MALRRESGNGKGGCAMSEVSAASRGTPAPQPRRTTRRSLRSWLLYIAKAARRKMERWSHGPRGYYVVFAGQSCEPLRWQTILRRALRMQAVGYQLRVLPMPCADSTTPACPCRKCPWSQAPQATQAPLPPQAADAEAMRNAAHRALPAASTSPCILPQSCAELTATPASSQS